MCSTWSASSSSTPPQAEVGRRTGELCQLCWDCLAFEETIDEAGQPRSSPMLVHDMPKVGVRGYRLPVGQAVVAVVRAQQARVQARYPNTATSLLALFPSVVRNARGTKAFSTSQFGQNFRSWVDSLAELAGPGGEAYDRSGITMYSFRHCYAQRHADAGAPVEVLAVCTRRLWDISLLEDVHPAAHRGTCRPEHEGGARGGDGATECVIAKRTMSSQFHALVPALSGLGEHVGRSFAAHQDGVARNCNGFEDLCPEGSEVLRLRRRLPAPG